MDSSLQNGPGGANGKMSRAQQFEKEKQDIVSSCFAKRAEDGTVMESYITHVRITEDAAYPSSPPPPDASTDTKKERIIIVAVRKSGNVRMHKARQNINGTFSIGKTWKLEDLTAVQSFSGMVPMSREEQLHKEWAGGAGFTVSLGKPYYWKANTQKEKQFFIASLIKIYTKYTNGKTPDLVGFDAREMEQFSDLRNRSTSAQPSSQTASPSGPVQSPAYGQPNRPRRDPSREPQLREQPSRDMRQMSPGGVPSMTSQSSRPQGLSRREDSPSGSFDSDRTAPPSLNRIARTNQSQESFTRSEDSSGLPPRSKNGIGGMQPAPGRFQERNLTPSQRTGTPDSTLSNGRDNNKNDARPIPTALGVGPPERLRPPMPNIGDPRQRPQISNDNMVPAPLASPGMRLPPKSSGRGQSRDQEPELRSPSGNGASLPSRPSQQDANQTEPTQSPAFTSALSPRFGATAPTVQIPVAQVSEEEERSGLAAVMSQSISSLNSPSPVSPETPNDEEVRPGLGPMIRKKKSTVEDAANSFLKTNNGPSSLNAFKPRAGGAAPRLQKNLEKAADGPDGITGVVRAPWLLSTNNSADSTPTSASLDKSPSRNVNDNLPEVKVTVPSDRPNSIQGTSKSLQEDAIPEKTGKTKTKEARRPKPASETMQKELLSLGIDPNVLGGRGNDLVTAWDEFGWVGEGVHTKNIDVMKEDIERELNKVQAGGWLTRLDEEDDRIAAIQSGLDTCIDESEQLDGLLTLYLVELSTRNEDIAYIEAQSQGLQVQAANQKLLRAELESLLTTISISQEELEPLRVESLESASGLDKIEQSLVTLYRAMLTIDPQLGGTSGARTSLDGSLSSGRQGAYGGSELGSMRVMQEKKGVYKNESAQFLRRLKPSLEFKFGAAIDETQKALEREKGSNLTRSGKVKLDPRNHDLARELLWRYSPLMLFTREVDRAEWEDLMTLYSKPAAKLYMDEYREAVFAWKRLGRKPTGDEGEILFTSQVEKQTEGLATTARKLTVKRSQTLAKSLRSPIGDNSSKTSLERGPNGAMQQYEVFSQLLDEVVPIISMEQNFVVDFFHVTSLEQLDFPEAVKAAIPDLRKGTDLKKPKVMDPNRDYAKKVVQVMEDIFQFLESDLQLLVAWSIQHDPLQGVGVLAAIERKLVDFEESNQEFLARTLQKLHTRLDNQFTKFLDEQIRAIEDTKVKIKKRKGVIGFVRIFPSFSLTLESMLVSADDLEVRGTINNAYGRINKAMFESLKVIARENPSAQTSGTDPEDKEALNYQILLIENMYHYLEEVKTRSNPVLEDWKQTAEQEMKEHMDLYLGAVIRRPLGKLLDYLESTEALILQRDPGESLSTISGMPSHSKTTFKKVLASYDSKEIKKGIEVLRKRVEKHFGDADDPNLSQSLVAKVQQECEKLYERIEDRILTISRDVYDGDIIADWTRADVTGAFRK